MDDLKNNMQDLALRYHKDMIVAEVSHGLYAGGLCLLRKAGAGGTEGHGRKRELAEKVPYPMTPEGGERVMRDITLIGTFRKQGARASSIGACVAASPRLRLGERSRTGIHRRTRPRRQQMGQSGAVRLRRNALPALKTIRDFGCDFD